MNYDISVCLHLHYDNMTCEYNYRAYCVSSGKDCGHSHHSIQSASQCAKERGWENDSKIITVFRVKFKKRSNAPRKQSKRDLRALNSPQKVKKKPAPRRFKRVDTGEEKIPKPTYTVVLPKKVQPTARTYHIDSHRDLSYFEGLSAYSPEFPEGSAPCDEIQEIWEFAITGDAYSQYLMGRYYEENSISCTKAVFWYRSSMENGCDLGRSALGRLLWSEKGESLEDTVRRQMSGDCYQKTLLGRMMNSGICEDINGTADNWLKLGYKMGDVDGLSYLGSINVCSGDVEAGVSMFKTVLSMEKSPTAMFYLGKYYVENATNNTD